MKLKKYILLTFSLMALAHWSSAQQINTLYFMNSVPQNTKLNPGKQSEAKWAVAFPVTNMGLNVFNGVSLNDVTYRSNDSTILDIDGLLDKLEDTNRQMSMLNSEVFGLYFQKYKWGVNLRVNYTNIEHLTYSKGLFNTVLKGPASQEVLGNPQPLESVAKVFGFMDVAIGGNYRINDKLVVGMTAKVLFGSHNVNAKLNGQIYQDDEANLPLVLNGNIELASNGLGDIVDEEGSVTIDGDNIAEDIATFKNVGFAIDLGATYQFSDKLSFEASALNLGTIFWKDDTNYNYNASLDSINYDGMDPVSLINGNADNPFPSIGDSLNFVDVAGEAPGNTPLPTIVNLAATYEFWDRATAGALFSQMFYEGEYYPSFTLSADKQFGKFFGFGLSYTADKFNAFNLGGMISVGFPGLQVYVLSDNILSAAIQYDKARAANLRFGINLPFGDVEKDDMPNSLKKRMSNRRRR
ncbi:DUF5723 family protein [Flammeovirga agarivorans]|uniref:DUF5723 domain-containing protein n=1 Tax=Flammeovirga agarivorans TaxID=2726742 RepID=A0A7X8SHE9_9BACT|nr:DUF5723 family protein [Flammeovirga agarivorans]NLR90296.1 hypothetical protein [Flammeovirga agarivorans]